MFKIQDGRENFVQWDLNRKIFVEDESITQVHFANLSNQNALVTEVKNHLADVPNVLLQDYGTILIYGCDGNYTKYSEAYRVLRREKPDNYVYTETEVLNYNNLLERINNVEGSIEQVVADYLLKNPPQVDLDGYATKEYVNNAIAAISAVGVQHITITDATELLNLETGLYIVDNEFTVNTLKGENTFSGALSVKQDYLNYTFIDDSGYLWYNDEDGTWDCSWYASQENIVELQEQINNIQSGSGVTPEEVDTAISEALANSGFQTENQVQTIVTGTVPTLDIDASHVKHIKGNPNSGWVLEGEEYTLQQMADAFDREFKAMANSLTTAQKNIVDTAISEAISAIGVAEGGTY